MITPRFAYGLGRAGLASLFLLAAINKLMRYDSVYAQMVSVGLEPAGLLLPMVILLEGLGGLLVAAGLRFSWLAAAALSLFTLATNAVFHRFWELSGEIATLELSLFFKNLAIAGALIAIAAIEWEKRGSPE